MPDMWHHLVNLSTQSWHCFRDSLGTTTLGFIAPLVVSALSIVLTLYYILRQHGREAMLKHWKGDARVAAKVTLIVTVLVYGPILFYEGLIKAVYDDHQSVVAANAQLLAANKALSARLSDSEQNAEQRCEQAKQGEINGLRKRISATCYLPDRRL